METNTKTLVIALEYAISMLKIYAPDKFYRDDKLLEIEIEVERLSDEL